MKNTKIKEIMHICIYVSNSNKHVYVYACIHVEGENESEGDMQLWLHGLNAFNYV